MTIVQYYQDTFSTIDVILSSFYGVYILLNLNFFKLQHNIRQTTILIVLSQLTTLVPSIRLMIIVTIIRLLLFVYFINNGIMFINNIRNNGNCKIFGIGNVSHEFFKGTISMDYATCRRGINYLAFIDVHFYFSLYRSETQIVYIDYTNDDFSVDLTSLRIDND